MKVKVKPGLSGFYLCIRNEGEVFDVPEDFGTIPSWLEKVEPEKKTEEKTDKK